MREGDGEIEDARASNLPAAAVQATARHVLGGECSCMPDADRAAARAAGPVRAMMRAVCDAGGLGSALHEQLGRALTYLVAPERAHADEADFGAYQAVVAGDLPRVDWPLAQGTDAEQLTRAREELAGVLAPCAIAVGAECEDMRRQWHAATRREVARRDERDANRDWLRLCMRAWREVADGVPAGAAAFDQRWARGEGCGPPPREVDAFRSWARGVDCALARRVRGGKDGERKWSEVTWLWARRVLTWQRLIRAGSVHRRRQLNPAWQAKREAEHRRLWYSCLPNAQGHETHEHDEQVAGWVHGRQQQQRQQQQQARSAARPRQYPDVSCAGAAASAASSNAPKRQRSSAVRLAPSHCGPAARLYDGPPTGMQQQSEQLPPQRGIVVADLTQGENGAQDANALHEQCDPCDVSGAEQGAMSGVEAGAAAVGHASAAGAANQPLPSDSSDSGDSTSASGDDDCERAQVANQRDNFSISGRRTRRTDHALALATPAQASLRCFLGGGETRLVHARRARGDG